MRRLSTGLWFICLITIFFAAGCGRGGDRGSVASCVVAEDQSITIDGKTIGIDEFVETVKERSPDKRVTFQVTPESQIKLATLEEIARRLRDDGYMVRLQRVSQ